MKPTPCPDQAALRGFVVGDLSADQLERVARHLEACPSCASALEALDALDDGLVRDLRGIDPVPGNGRADVPAALLDAARSVLSEANGAAEELVVDAGARIAADLAHGPLRSPR